MTQRRSRSLRRWIILAALVAVLTGAGVALRAKLHPAATIDPSKLSSVERGDLARAVVATGKIQPKTEVLVKSKASGIVKKIHADYGDYVREGQVLVELDKEELQAQVREAKASLIASEAAVESAEAAYERNKADAEGTDVPYLKSAAERAKKLFADGLIAASLQEDADKAYRMSLNKQSVAMRSVAVTKAELSKAKAQVAQAQAALDRAQENLAYSTITSPMNGLVLSRDVQVGDAVSSILVMGATATLVMTLGDVSDVYVLGKVGEADIAKVFVGQPARIAIESLRDTKFQGVVTKISPLGVEKENVTNFEVRVSIRNPNGQLKANMSANAEIILEEKKNVMMVPDTALIYDKDRHASIEIPDITQEKGRKKVPVQLGISNGVKTELVSGLKAGDKIILQ